MKLNRTIPAAALVLAASIALSGCASAADGASEPKETSSPKTSATPEATKKPEATKAPATASGEAAAPGTRVGLGEAQVTPFTGTDDVKALISTRLVSIDPATDAQTAFLVEQIPQLKGYSVTLMRVEQTKISGDPVAYNADYTSFRPVDTEGEQAQEVTLIGWEDCESVSFPTEFDTAGAVVTQCIVAASVEGGNAIGGVLWDGGNIEPNPYDYYDGTPLLFMK